MDKCRSFYSHPELFDETCVDTPEKRIAFNHLHNNINALENKHENEANGKDTNKITIGTSEVPLNRHWYSQEDVRQRSVTGTKCEVNISV